MFEDSLAESTGRIRTGSRWYAIGSFIFQVSLLAVLIVIPYLYPDSLPKQALSTLLLAPPPPASPAQETRAPRCARGKPGSTRRTHRTGDNS